MTLTAPPLQRCTLQFECLMDGDRLMGVILKDVDGDEFHLDPRTRLDLTHALWEVSADFVRVRTPGYCQPAQEPR